jgi:hypothetical protein
MTRNIHAPTNDDSFADAIARWENDGGAARLGSGEDLERRARPAALDQRIWILQTATPTALWDARPGPSAARSALMWGSSG